MRRWQPSLELLLHHAPIAGLLHLCFPLGHSRRLPLVACRFLLPWSRLAKNRIVLSNISWQFEPSLFVLRHFFLFGMSLGLDVKWAGVAKFFVPTIYIYIYTHFFYYLLISFSFVFLVFLIVLFNFPKTNFFRNKNTLKKKKKKIQLPSLNLQKITQLLSQHPQFWISRFHERIH